MERGWKDAARRRGAHGKMALRGVSGWQRDAVRSQGRSARDEKSRGRSEACEDARRAVGVDASVRGESWKNTAGLVFVGQRACARGSEHPKPREQARWPTSIQ